MIRKAIKKHGLQNFTKTILAIAGTKEVIDVLEKIYIKLYREQGKAEYNIANGGDGGNLGELVNEKFKGKNNPFYGKHHSIEAIEKNRQAHIGKVPNEIAKVHMSESQKGRKHSEKTKQKMSESAKGKIFTEEHLKNLSESHKGQVAWNKGKKMTDEQKKNVGRKKGCVPWNKGMRKN